MILHKYSGSGNDFLIFHHFLHTNRSQLAKTLCDRHNGIGADGMVVLLPHQKYAYEWEFYNSDGSEAKMCGNASRCVAHYAYHQGLAPANHSFLTPAGEIQVCVQKDIVRSNLGKYQPPKSLEIPTQVYGKNWYLIDTGVPHLVHFVEKKSNLVYLKNDTLINLRQTYNANVNIAYIKDKTTIYLSTYERGVEDITLACGTGMAAVFVIANLEKNISEKATLIPPSQEKLTLSLEDKNIIYEGKVKEIGVFIHNQNR